MVRQGSFIQGQVTRTSFEERMIDLHAMCRLTCYRCWRELIRISRNAPHRQPLAELLILVPGDGRFLTIAQQLAVDLALPVRFVLFPTQTLQILHNARFS